MPENSLRSFFFGALKAQLEMIESRGHKFFKALFIERKSRGDHARVEAGAARGANDFAEIGTRERLASGEVGLQHAQFGRFAQDARPGGGGKFAGSRRQLQWDWNNRRNAADTGESARRQERVDLKWRSSGFHLAATTLMPFARMAN